MQVGVAPGYLLRPVGRRRPAAQIDVAPGVTGGGTFSGFPRGDPPPLVPPPQGGHVSFVAARARNVDPCRVRISATLRSPRNARIIAEESRDISMTPLPTGWAEPNLADISSVANVPLCPDYHDEPIVDTEYTLEVRLDDHRGAALVGNTSRTVVPRCLEDD